MTIHSRFADKKILTVYTGICIICHVIPITFAAEEGVNWPTVGVAWAFSLVTSVLVVLVTLVIARYLRHRKKRRNAPPKMSRELSVQSEVSDMTHASLQSGQPLYVSSAGYRRVPSRESSANRRKSDFISTWCSKHGLSEVIAANLRENGFTSRGQIEALQPGDVMTLGLTNLAQQVQLRKVLENLEKASTEPHTPEQGQASLQPRLPSGSTNSDRTRPRSSTTNDESSFANTPSPKQSVTMEPFYSDRYLGPESIPQHHSLHQGTSQPHSSYHGKSQTSTLYLGSKKPSRLRFHGLLSDAGLYELADSLGAEWRHVAAMLGINKAQQEHLVNDFPGNTKQQIFEMLRVWRENEKGGKEQVKAVLSEAFRRVRRKDLSDRILREQVHGSDEHLQGGTRVNSVV